MLEQIVLFPISINYKIIEFSVSFILSKYDNLVKENSNLCIIGEGESHTMIKNFPTSSISVI